MPESDQPMAGASAGERPATGSWIAVALAWTAVGLPLAWGVWITLEKAWVLFR